MRVVLDANVVIAAAATRGLCEAVFELCLERHRLLVCEGLLAEIRQILLGKLRLSPDLTAEYLRLLRDVAEMLVPAPVEPDACRDPDDAVVLGLAVAGRAELIVTGDKDLLVLRQYQSTRIVTPREFWDAVQSGEVS